MMKKKVVPGVLFVLVLLTLPVTSAKYVQEKTIVVDISFKEVQDNESSTEMHDNELSTEVTDDESSTEASDIISEEDE